MKRKSRSPKFRVIKEGLSLRGWDKDHPAGQVTSIVNERVPVGEIVELSPRAQEHMLRRGLVEVV